MKFFLFSLFIILNFSAISQTILPDNFKIGNFVEIFNTESIKIYFNCTGTVADKKCASYYRVGKMDSTIINVTGNFYDYDMNGKVFLKATMLNNNLEGAANYYYKNGGVMEEGTYQNNIRQGKWTFYYPNGNIRKIYNYSDGDPTVLEAYTSNGKASVNNGNGSFKTEFSTYKQCDKFEASGQLLNGKKDGKWVFSNPNTSLPIATEIYENGNFLKGSSNNYKYTENPTILLTNFYPNENLNLSKNWIGCPGNSHIYWQYKDSNVHTTFFPELKEQLTKYNSTLQNQWVVIGIKISKKSELSEINVASSINDLNFESYIYDILLKMKDWKTAIINSNKIESNIFFTILVDNDQIIIPADYLYHNR